VSQSLREALRNGSKMVQMAWSASQLCMAVDGMDQAKFRVPRILRKTHELDKLVRPALHVHGAWAHGFAYHLAVMDSDMTKDTCVNVEVIGRMLDQVVKMHKTLPLGLHLQQDNTCRECKNQNIIKWACKLVALDVLQYITFAYMTVGHTHCELDGTFGQVTVKLARREFDDDMDVVKHLNEIIESIGIDEESKRGSMAFKCDEAADWVSWWNEVPVEIKQITGPRSPQFFRIVRRCNLGRGEGAAAEAQAQHTPFPGNFDQRPGDVMMVSKAEMHDDHVHEVRTILPEGLQNGFTRQPVGLHSRRRLDMKLRSSVSRAARKCAANNGINAKAAAYLTEWAGGTRPKQHRPQSYSFLERAVNGRGQRSIKRAVPASRADVWNMQVRMVRRRLTAAEREQREPESDTGGLEIVE